MLLSLITALHVFVALFMILVVLLQGGNSGGIGATLGGGNSSGVFGATGANSMLTKLTYIAAVIFMITSLSLSIMKSKAGTTGLYDRIKEEATQPVAPEGVLDNLDNLEKMNDTLLDQKKTDEATTNKGVAPSSTESKDTTDKTVKKENKKDTPKTDVKDNKTKEETKTDNKDASKK